MTPEQAITQIESMRFRPGWTLHAQQTFFTGPGAVYVWAEVKTFDTSYRAPDGTLTRPLTLHPEALIRVSGLDEAGLVAALLRDLVRPFDEHEDREFLACSRPGGRWYAPLHPHTPEGERAWERHAGLVTAAA